VVSLANNHVFDCLWPGFERLRALLRELGVAWFGAGADLAEAAAPAVVEANGLRLAFLGAVDPATGARQIAGPGSWGVAPLETQPLVERIRRLRPEVDHVVVCPHWGEERFGVPSPAQVAQARAFAEAGASAVLGHHPHVLQGVETHAGTPVIYSLGNFVATEVPYTTGDRVTWNRTERTACVLELELGPSGAVRRIAQRPTYDDGVAVRPDRSGFGARRIRHVDREVARGVSARRYRWEHLWVKRVKPVLAQLRWSRLRRLRPAKLWAGLGRLGRALRGSRSA
jgi:poly-gamma-glutamate synthesis protein (capsule biosynthesis protein)